jgi:HK97 family phage portal protein
VKLSTRIKSFFGGGLEGSYRGAALGIGEYGHSFEIPFGDGFQRNLDMSGVSARNVPAVYAAVTSFARAVSQCYPSHKVISDDGKHEIQTTSPASRVLRSPNAYQTWPQFIYNCVATMLFEGESLALIVRDSRYAPIALHLMPRGSWMPYIDPESQEIFYSIGSNPMLADSTDALVPARDVIHFRQYTPRHPLVGESPIKAAAMAIGINVALSQTQATFFTNMNRPSGILSTEQTLNLEQMKRLREAFNEQSKAWSKGGMPILANGLKFDQMSVNSVDAQLIEAQRMSIEDIARVYGVPLPVIGDLSHATLANTEQLINMWLSMSLGSLLENIERSFDKAFGFSQNEYTELDVAALLRTDFLGRIDGLVKATQGGLFTPNEARSRENLPPVEFGDVPYMQQQMVELGTKPAAPVAPDANKPDGADKEEPKDIETDKSFDVSIAKALLKEYMAK